MGLRPDRSHVKSARVVGVMPEGFAYPADANVWMPKELFSDDSGRTGHNLEVVARIKRGNAKGWAPLSSANSAVRRQAQLVAAGG
jgi:hypothetical protein